MSVRRSVTWMMASQGGLFVVQFGGSVVLARLLTPYEMGVYALGSAVVGIIGIVQAFGLALLIIRERQVDRDLLAGAFTMNAILSIFLSVAIVGFSALGTAILREPGVRDVMLVLAVIPLIGIFEFLPLSLIERDAEFKVIAAINLLRAGATTAVTLALALAGWSYMSIAWGAVAGSGASAAGAMIAGRRHLSFRLDFSAWRKILAFGLQQLAIQGLNSVAGRVSEFCLGKLLGLEALGLYARASSLNNLLFYNIHVVVGRVAMVDLADQRRAGRSLHSGYLRTVGILTALLWPSFAGLAILAGPFIQLVYGPAWVAAAPAAAGLAVAAMLLISLSMAWEVFVVCHETGRQVRYEFIRTGAGLLFFIGGCFVSIGAAAIARIAEAVFSIALYRPDIERMTDTRWSDFAPIYRRNAIVTAAACAPALAVMTAFEWSPRVPFAIVALAVMAGVLSWLLALKLLDHHLAAEDPALRLEGKGIRRNPDHAKVGRPIRSARSPASGDAGSKRRKRGNQPCCAGEPFPWISGEPGPKCVLGSTGTKTWRSGPISMPWANRSRGAGRRGPRSRSWRRSASAIS